MLKKMLLNFLCLLALGTSAAPAQTTNISTEYLMTFYAPLDPPQQINSSLTVFNVRDGGWVKGPKINGTLLTPTADWLRVMPGGNFSVDVRGTIKTDDDALIYITYNGVIHYPRDSLDRLANGELLKADDYYFVVTPILQTSSEKYDWLNNVQCVGKAAEVKLGENSFVKYDIFLVR